MNKFLHSDPLCKKVYDWEDGQRLAGIEIFKLGTVKRWIAKACKYYRVPPPKVIRASPGARTSGYDPKDETILFVPFHLNPVVVLHEAAHHIADKLLGSEHGPIHSDYWFQIYLWLLLKFEVYEPAFLRGSLKPYRLTLRPLSPAHFRH